MSHDTLISELTVLLKKALMSGIDLIRPEDDLRRDLGIDSMGTVDFVMSLEEKYSITISDDELERVNTFNDAIDLVSTKMAAA